MKELLVVDLGLVEYGAAWELQRRVAAARKAAAIPDVLLLCEHPHVITLGRSGKISNLRAPDHVLRQMGVSFFETNRGGDITYHGPGQLVGYPILNLAEIRRDVGWYVRSLEEAMIRATAEYGMASKRVSGCTGVWVDVAVGSAKGKEVEEMNDEEKLRYANHVRYMIPLEPQLGFLRAAGFEGVDVFWKELDFVIYGGRRPL